MVVETKPGRIEAVVLVPGGVAVPGGSGPAPELTDEKRKAIDAMVKGANATLGTSQRIVAWRPWPSADFPRTHTLKVKRDQVRALVAADAALPVSDGSATG